MEKQTTITFYSGLDTIGGVVMEVRYGNCRVLMEMGSAYNPSFDLYDGNVKPRTSSYLKDALWLNDAARIDGIYAKEHLSNTGLCSAEESTLSTVILISHLHLDHMRNMGLVSPLIPIYLSSNAQKIEKALEETGNGIFTWRNNYLPLEQYPHISVGEIQITPFLLNEDSYQDYSFYVETPDLKLHYTGDVFVYGKYEDAVRKEASWLKKQKIDLLVCEGTSFLPGMRKKVFKDDSLIYPAFEPINGMISKEALDERIIKTICQEHGPVIFNLYEREMSDVMDFERYARECGRTIVYEPETAHIINRFFNHSVYTLVLDFAQYKEEAEWMKEVIRQNTLVTQEEILASPSSFLLQNSYPHLLELLDYRNMDALYLHHSGTPLGSYDPAYERMMRIVTLSGMRYYPTYQNDFLSHAAPNQLLAYMEMIAPRLLVPAHCSERTLLSSVYTHPSFLAQENIHYVYDRTSNTLKETV